MTGNPDTSSGDHGPCDLCSIASRYSFSLGDYLGSKLPQRTIMACYASDAAVILADKVELYLERLCSSSTRAQGRHPNLLVERRAIAYGSAASLVRLLSKDEGLFTGANGEWLRRSLERRSRGSASLLDLPESDQFAAWCSRTMRLAHESIERNGLRSRSNDTIEEAMVLGTVVSTLLQLAADTASQPSFNHVMQPLLRSSQEERSVDPLRPPASADSYDDWAGWCLRLARMRRIPDRLVSDLLPPAEVADHSTNPPELFEDGLEAAYPGRRAWVRASGATEAEIAEYWQLPRWVQQFVQKMMVRNLQLEVQALRQNGDSDEDAFRSAVFFVPMFSIEPTEPHPDAPLPIEMAIGSIRFLAAQDDATLERNIMASQRFSASGYLRTLSPEVRLAER